MRYCPKCKMMIRGPKECCPLCQGLLYDERLMKRHSVDIDSFGDDVAQLLEEDDDAAGFPVIKKPKVTSLSLLQLGTFVFLAAEIIGFAFMYLMGDELPWLPIVMISFFIGWLDLIVLMFFASNILKVITTEVIVAIIVNLWADAISGFHGWSIAWMIPVSLVVLAVVTVIISEIRGLKLPEYIIYLLVDTGLSILQLIPIALKINRFPWPAVLSIAAFLILLSGTLVFRFRDLKSASVKVFSL